MYRDQFGELVCGYCGLLVWKKTELLPPCGYYLKVYGVFSS